MFYTGQGVGQGAARPFPEDRASDRRQEAWYYHAHLARMAQSPH